MDTDSSDVESVGFRSRPFWETLQEKGTGIALIDPEESRCWSYRSLGACVISAAEHLPLTRPGLVFLFGENDFGGIATYLGALLAGHSVYLLSTKIYHPSVVRLVSCYNPDIILTRLSASNSAICQDYAECDLIFGYHCYRRACPENTAIHPELSLLISTSASTGNPKTVKISQRGLLASTFQVMTALQVTESDRAITSLPFTHVYGLSVVNSHLAAGASLVLQKRSIGDPVFWEHKARWRWTTLAGVRTTYELVNQQPARIGALRETRKLLHSGDAMPSRIFDRLYSELSADGVGIYLMYGQTETCGRISVLPPTLLPEHSSSVGLPVPLGKVSIAENTEIVYRGPNAMMGYASCRADLSLGDQTKGCVHTGDSGYIDSNNLLHVTGRLARTCKLFGQRICLDDLEKAFQGIGPVAAVREDDKVALYFEASTNHIRAKVLTLARAFRIPPQSFLLRQVASFPRTEAGKISYRDLSSPASTNAFDE